MFIFTLSQMRKSSLSMELKDGPEHRLGEGSLTELAFCPWKETILILDFLEIQISNRLSYDLRVILSQ